LSNILELRVNSQNILRTNETLYHPLQPSVWGNHQPEGSEGGAQGAVDGMCILPVAEYDSSESL
jgi:hypothetical protein